MTSSDPEFDAVVVGTGPNGMTAAARLATEGYRVVVFERSPTIGGGARTMSLGFEGAIHDLCSAVHPLGATSIAFRALGLTERGLRWIQPPFPVAHPLPGGRAGVIHQSMEETAAGLGIDGRRYRTILGPIVDAWDGIDDAILSPMFWPPPHLVPFVRFGLRALPPVSAMARLFRTDEARALLAGLAAHAMLPLQAPFTSAPAMVLAGAAHAVGWPVAAGGSQAIVDALARRVTEAGGVIETGHEVARLDDLPPSTVTLLDVTPRQLVQMAGSRLPGRVRRAMLRFRYGPGVCKVDYVLSGPVPWTASACTKAGTVHVGGRFERVAFCEEEIAAGRLALDPFVLVGQPSICDPSRAPAGHHVIWAYCHTPANSTVDCSATIERIIEGFAPGFRDLIEHRFTRTAAGFEAYNPNYRGGNIASGAMGGTQMLFRPRVTLWPYRIGIDGVYLCSASTPPGGGAHGMCGWHAAGDALRQLETAGRR